MDNTTQYNPAFPENEPTPNEPNAKRNNEGLKVAGIAAGAAVAGAGATMAANHFASPAEDEENADVAEVAEATEATEAAEAPAAPRGYHNASRANTSNAPRAEHKPDHKEPTHEEKGEVTDREHTEQENHTQEQHGPVNTQEQPGYGPVDQPGPNNVQNQQSSIDEPPVDEPPRPINPDENIPEIAETEIDPTDFDGEAYVEFGEVAKVYNVDGSESTMASAVTADGDEMVMIDIDGDEIFDAIADNEGQVISYDTAGMTVGDAEVQIDNGPDMAYIEPTDNEMPLPEGEDFMNDIVDA